MSINFEEKWKKREEKFKINGMDGLWSPVIEIHNSKGNIVQ
jgi:hypothetical protein